MNETVTQAGQLTVALLILGTILKRIPKFPDAWIPTTLTLIGTVAYMSLHGWTTIDAIYGIQTAAAATGLNQIYKQHTNGNNNEAKPNPPASPAGPV